ncbi:unnamed protein product [Lactuca virosa]|uniref:Phorbol-ester/DAG-type domain-containing protein n=1 Tax=Lactuca virosa TaxID=75947 RepID=A0AAU9N1Z7_9ASTR|nr:unnamed protein product [Lactuca virosa]
MMEVIHEVPGHEHPLKLIDLQLQYEDEEDEEEEEEDEEGGSLIKKDGFHGVTCGRCGEEIHMYHRYYYTCCSSSCDDFSLHKFCGELPSRLVHPSHPPHTLHLQPCSDLYLRLGCQICRRHYNPGQHLYKCYQCHFSICVRCGMEVGKNVIHHPCHPHSLMCTITEPILCCCKACGKRHEGIFYQCTICTNFTIHTECAFLPEKLLIQEKTDGAFHHTHPLTISYSFPFIDQQAKHRPRCRVCGGGFFGTEDLWIYKCDKCMYYAHLDYATSRREPFMSIFLSAGAGRTNKNYKDVDHPGLLHLPFPDDSYSLPKHNLFFQQTTNDDDDHHHHKIKVDDRLSHKSHQHPLILVDHGQTSSSSSNSLLLIKCHDPMKKTQLICNGCLRPIMSTMPFYICANANSNANDDEIQIQSQGVCNNFALHEWCTRLPQEIENHPGHPQHTLHLIYSNNLHFFFGVFHCAVCRLPCNGFVYGCVECEYYLDVTCGLIPKQITHETHPSHILSLVRGKPWVNCHMCPNNLPVAGQFSFRCDTCDIYIHLECALLLVETVRHKCDKHPMHLSYLPIENHKSEYFCEICEEDLNPHQSFYHCQDYAQSVHTACAPSILECETETYTNHNGPWIYQGGVHYFVNIKFGGIYRTQRHSHPLSFAQGIVLDDLCSICNQELQYEMIFKCLECNFVIDYYCCK